METFIPSKELFQLILDGLKADPYFQQFKFRKYDSTFYIKDKQKKLLIELEHWSDIVELNIRPIYGVRYEVLSKWYEKFTPLSIKDERDAWHIFLGGHSYGKDTIYYFSQLSWKDFKKDFKRFKEDVKEISADVFARFDSLEKYYNEKIIPILDGSKELPDGGIDWIFPYLQTCLMLHPENYERLKKLVFDRIDFMRKRGEWDVIHFKEGFDKVADYMENLVKEGKLKY